MKLLPIFLVVLLAACSGGGETATSNVPNSENSNVIPSAPKAVMVWNGAESWDDATWK